MSTAKDFRAPTNNYDQAFVEGLRAAYEDVYRRFAQTDVGITTADDVMHYIRQELERFERLDK